MSGVVLSSSEASSQTLPHKKFTREEVERLLETGFFDGERYELIDGDLIDKMGQNPPHAYSIQGLMVALLRYFDSRQIRVQLSMEAGGADRERSVPEPDVAVLAEGKEDYARRHPRGDECLLVAEVSDTTAKFDLSRKADLYANAGVREYWVVDLNRRTVIVHKEPRGGTYRFTQMFLETDAVPLIGRTETIPVAELLPTEPDTVR
jgi:Uma2 family endonuclease